MALSVVCITRKITIFVDHRKLNKVFRKSHGLVTDFIKSSQLLCSEVFAPGTDSPKNHFMAFELSGYLTIST
jgi:hypothetical protein